MTVKRLSCIFMQWEWTGKGVPRPGLSLLDALTVSTCGLTGHRWSLPIWATFPKYKWLCWLHKPESWCSPVSRSEVRSAALSDTIYSSLGNAVHNCPSVCCHFVQWIFCWSLCKLLSRVYLTVQLTTASYSRYFEYITLLIQSSFVVANWGPHHQKHCAPVTAHLAQLEGSIFIFSHLLVFPGLPIPVMLLCHCSSPIAHIQVWLFKSNHCQHLSLICFHFYL